MEQERKMVMPNELIIGNVYADVPYLDTVPTLLRYEGLTENQKSFRFTLAKGEDFYGEEDGYILFPSSCEFYLPLPNEL